MPRKAMTNSDDKDIRIMVIDDHPVVATGLKLTIAQRPRFIFMGAIPSPELGVTLVRANPPDALIVDLAFDGHVQTNLITQLREIVPDALIIAFSSLPARLYMQTALAAGADAFISKEQDLDLLLDTVADLADGRAPARSMIFEAEVAPLPSDADNQLGIYMTSREQEIAHLLSRGESIQRISEFLGIGIKTASAHRDNLRKKLGCSDSRELIARLAKHYGDNS